MGRGGDRTRGGYYSFDLGQWHIVALDSTCDAVPGGCEEGSPQQRWLAADLARHHTRCTLAFWHHPLFSSLAFEEGRGSRDTRRCGRRCTAPAPTSCSPATSTSTSASRRRTRTATTIRAHGLRSFVVGTGGKSLDNADFRDHNTSAFSATAFGVLELTLHPRGYNWRFASAGPEPFSDRGRAACH